MFFILKTDRNLDAAIFLLSLNISLSESNREGEERHNFEWQNSDLRLAVLSKPNGGIEAGRLRQ